MVVVLNGVGFFWEILKCRDWGGFLIIIVLVLMVLLVFIIKWLVFEFWIDLVEIEVIWKGLKEEIMKWGFKDWSFCEFVILGWEERWNGVLWVSFMRKWEWEWE